MQVSKDAQGNELFEFPSDWDIQFSFGQYKGRTPREVVKDDKNALQYILWAIDTVHHYKPSAQFTEEVREQWEAFEKAQRLSGQYHPREYWNRVDYYEQYDDDDAPRGDLDDDIPF